MVLQNIGIWFWKQNVTCEWINRFVVYWIFLKPPRQDFLRSETDIKSWTCVDWCSYLYEVCYHVVSQNHMKLGGRNKIIEIDDAEIGHRECNCVRLVDGNRMFCRLKHGGQNLF